MKKKLYHKLVRDRIPEVLESAGKQYEVRQLAGPDIIDYAFKKLREEVQEFVEDPSPEEAADVLEVFEFLCARLGIPPQRVKAQRLSKRVTKGGFDMGFLLEWVED